MKVFISWSGRRSYHVALALREFLGSVIQSAKPFVSDVDIAKGEPWFAKIEAELKESKFGIICLTPENQMRPFLNFEAGALAKQLGATRVCPYLIDMTSAELMQPLAQFQCAHANKHDTFKLLKSVNAMLPDSGLESARLRRVFNRFWDDLDRELRTLPSVRPTPNRRTDREVLDEILELTRSVLLHTREHAVSDPCETRSSDPRTVPAGSGWPPSTDSPPGGQLSAQEQDVLETMNGGDAPLCDCCGHITVRSAGFYKCLNCGNSIG